jgi:hypothetical protein
MEKLSLTLTLSSPQGSTGEGQLPEARVTLTNNGPEPVLVNGRMLLIPEEYPGRLGEISLLVDGPPGSFDVMVANVRSGEAPPENFVLLLPGEYKEKKYAMGDYFDCDMPGEYVVRARYHNEVTCRKSGYEGWVGELESDEVRFRIGEG